MSRIVSLVLCSCAVAVTVAGCKAAKERQSDTAATAAQAGAQASGQTAAAAGAVAPTPISVAVMQGTWHGRSMPVNNDSTTATWTLSSGSDTAHWTTTFSTGTKAPVHVVAVAGDSIVTKMGPYKSVTMKGQLATADVVARVRGDSMFGTFVMHSAAQPEKVLTQGRLVAARAKP